MSATNCWHKNIPHGITHLKKLSHSVNVWRLLSRILVEKLEGKRPLGRPRHRLKDNIKMDLRDIGWGGGDWIWLRIRNSGGSFCTRY
jgi:hypothetical protein